MTNIQKAGILIGIIFVFSLGYYLTVETQSPEVKVYTKPPAMAGAAKLPVESVQMPKGIRAIKPEAVEKLGVVVLPDQHVTATATLPKSKGGYDVVSVTDDDGGTLVITKEKPPALFSIDNSWRMGLGIGVDTRSGQAGKVFVEYTPLVIFGVTAGIDGQLNFHPSDLRSPVSAYGGVILFKSF